MKNLYYRLFSEAPSGFALHKKVDREGKSDYEFVEVNAAFTDIFGMEQEELAGKMLNDLLLGDIGDFDWPGLYEKAEKTGQYVRAEFNIKAQNKWLQIDAAFLEEGFFSSQITDVTESKNQFQLLERENHLFQNVINGANVGIWEWNVQTGEQIINERWAGIIGYTKEELEPINLQTWRIHTHPEDLAESEKEIERIFMKVKTNYTLIFRMKHKAGHWIWIESNGIVNSRTSEGKPLIVSGSHVDITKRKIAEDALKENERRLITSQEIAHVGNWDLDLETHTMWGSKEAFKIYGIERTSDHLPLKEVQALVLPEYREMMDKALIDLIAGRKEYNVEYKMINGFTGRVTDIHSKAILLKENGKPVRVIGTIRDRTEEMERQKELYYLGYHDQLTGLYNRRFFKEEIAKHDNLGYLPLTIVLCDVNGLKLVNDSFGHDLGDELLIKVGQIIRAGCRDGDILSRYGGDEFALILPNTDETEAKQVVKGIKELIAGERVGAFDISVSFGYGTKYDKAEDINTISKNAEDHMYRHKLYESESARSRTVDLIISTLYEKNTREMQHSKRVSALCASFANYLNVNKEEIDKMKIAGLMHDIGKIGIDEEILNKKTPLTDNEWGEIKRHSEIGYRILSSVNELSEIAEYVLEHQEKWDGTGYPKGLKGTEISYEARMISICDAYDAMTGARTYGKECTKEEALLEIERCAGTQFDPELAKLFISCFQNNENSGDRNEKL